MLLLAPEAFWKCLTNLAVRCWRLLLLLCVLEFSVQVLEHVLVTFPCVHDFLEQTQRATGQQTPFIWNMSSPRVTLLNPSSVSPQVPKIPPDLLRTRSSTAFIFKVRWWEKVENTNFGPKKKKPLNLQQSNFYAAEFELDCQCPRKVCCPSLTGTCPHAQPLLSLSPL